MVCCYICFNGLYGLKENGQNPDSRSKNSENQNNDAIL